MIEQFAELLTLIDDIVENLQHLLGVPFCYDGNDIYLTARAGIALYPRDASGREAVIRAATVNRYRGLAGRRRRTSDLPPAEELELISRLHRAMEHREFRLHYQPVVDLHDRRPIGVEALLRWMPAGREPVPPASFIPVAERTGLIAPITDWIVSEVCAQSRNAVRRYLSLWCRNRFSGGKYRTHRQFKSNVRIIG